MVLIDLIVISIISGGTYFVVSKLLSRVVDEFAASAFAMFISFFMIPSIFLALGIPSRRGHKLGKFDTKFLLCLLLYQVFTLWILAYLPRKHEFFMDFSIGSMGHISYIILVGLYVPPVDFFTRRVIQSEVSLSFGKWAGFSAGTAAWLVGHIPEIVWLSELMGPWGSAVFIIVSGLVTGLLFMRYKNVLGLMGGHWVLNIIISLAPALI